MNFSQNFAVFILSTNFEFLTQNKKCVRRSVLLTLFFIIPGSNSFYYSKIELVMSIFSFKEKVCVQKVKLRTKYVKWNMDLIILSK